MHARAIIRRAAVREYLTYDFAPFRPPLAWAVWMGARAALALPADDIRAATYNQLLRLHSGSWAIDSVTKPTMRRSTAVENAPRGGDKTGLGQLFETVARGAVSQFRAGAHPDPRRLIGSRILVVKAARPHERGVIVVDYSYVFPLMAGLFDLPRLANRYAIVLEPSWAGASAPEILLYTTLAAPVTVQTIEPRDQALIKALGTNLETVPVAANWWADHRRTAPLGGNRDIDVIMVAAWADIKRHWRVFRVLSQLRAAGHRLKVALVGYRYDRTKDDIESLATYFGIRDQVETHERISQEAVSGLLARSKVHVLWSRRECANRAIIEAMLADVPVIVRDGLTFGFRYPYINEHTGRFVPEAQLGQAILEMIATRDRYAPREWVLQHMTAEQATSILESQLADQARRAGQPWSEGLVVKTSTLDSQRYWVDSDRDRFQADYAFIESTLAPNQSGSPAGA